LTRGVKIFFGSAAVKKDGLRVQGRQHQGSDAGGGLAVVRQVLVVLDRARLRACAVASVAPGGIGQQLAGGLDLTGTQQVGQGQDHGQNFRLAVSWNSRPAPGT
jgi:hypothetical protein